ncbi:MAG: hypothetical protein ACK41O_26705, partial [Runella zeae]
SDPQTIDITGNHTRWGVWNPNEINNDPSWYSERGSNSLEMLAWLDAAHLLSNNQTFAVCTSCCLCLCVCVCVCVCRFAYPSLCLSLSFNSMYLHADQHPQDSFSYLYKNNQYGLNMLNVWCSMPEDINASDDELLWFAYITWSLTGYKTCDAALKSLIAQSMARTANLRVSEHLSLWTFMYYFSLQKLGGTLRRITSHSDAGEMFLTVAIAN